MQRLVTLTAIVGAMAVSASHAQVLRRVLDIPAELTTSVAIDDAGTVTYAVSTTNQFGTNPGYLRQIVRWDLATGIGTPITDFEEGVDSVSVSDDGAWLAFVTRADLLGTNHDESPELYVMQSNGSGLAQLTSENVPPLVDRGVLGAVISGSANRIAFVGKVNPLGTNPTYTSALFVIDRSGANLRQLRLNVRLALQCCPALYPPGPGVDISDDGSRVVYITSTSEIGGINADGTGNKTFTSTTNAADVVISGDGARVAYATGFPGSRSVRSRTFDGNPATIVGVGPGEAPKITDDAAFLYLARYAAGNPSAPELWRLPTTGSVGSALISAGTSPAALSGSGNRVVARGSEILAMDNAGANVQQLTTTTVRDTASNFSISSDGDTAHFRSTFDPLGTNPAHRYEYFSHDMGTGQFWQRTSASTPNMTESVMSGDGSVFFMSDSDPVGQNSCAQIQLFRLSPMGVYTQLTACGDPLPISREYLEVRPDGEVALFLAWVGNDLQLFAVHGDGTGRTSLGETYLSTPDSMRAAGTGPDTWVVYTTSNLTESDGGLFRVKADGTALQQLTTPAFEDRYPSISADGSVVAWSSARDYGSNPDLSHETFLLDVATQTIQQITSNESWPPPLVTQDGQWVFAGLRRFHVASNTPEFLVAHGLPDATGSRWLVEGKDSVAGNDVFGGVQGGVSLFLADENAVPSFVVGKPSPTVLSWDYSPFSLRYDVIRGSIANLSTAGSTVSLGPVSCLEDDSPDNHTRGHGDPVDPAPGQGFFFLYRGSVGANAAAGSYGQGTGGLERVAGAGGCAP